MPKRIKIKILKKLSGFSLVELIVAIGIFSILASGVVYVFVTSYKNFFGVGDKQVVVQFAQEGMEAARSIRDNGWQTIVENADGDPKGVQKTNGLWQFSGVDNTLGDLTRVIVVSAVERNSTGSIVDSGGTDDPDTKKVTVTVSGTGIADYVLVTYFTNWSAKTWEQSDWSGTGSNEFWASMITASSSYSDISTTTAGQLTLTSRSGTSMSWNAWADLEPDTTTNYIAYRDAYDIHMSSDNNSMYVVGTTNHQLLKYDISKAYAGIVSIQLKKVLPWHMSQMVLNPNGNYAYLGRRAHAYGVGAVCVADLTNTNTIVSGDCVNVTSAYTGVFIMDMVVTAAGDWLYMFDNQGYAYSFAISNGGATLTLVNDAQLIASAGGNSINGVYLDESGASPYIYIVSDDNSGEFRKMGVNVGFYFSSTSTSAYVDSTYTTDITSLKFLEAVSSKNRFIFGTENSSAELLIVEDQGSSLTQLGSYNLSTSQSSAVVDYDGANTAFIYYYSPAGLYTVDITNRSNPIDGGLVKSFARRANDYPYSGLAYSSTAHGLFLLEHNTTDNTVNLYYVGKPLTRATGGTYNYKRKITLGLTDKVSAGPHTDFPVVISETQDYLKSVANGGKVESANGYDIIFTSDVDGNTLLDHEVEYYDPVTGEFTAWVKIPSLASNTEIYMFYGNTSVTASQEDVSGVWSNSYQIVNHMVDDSTTGTKTSIYGGNSAYKNGVNSPIQSTGKIGRGQAFDGDKITTPYDWITIDNSPNKIQGTSDFTVEFWINPSSTYTIANEAPVYFGCGDLGKQDGWMFAYDPASTKRLRFAMGDNNVTNLSGLYTTALTSDIWTHVALTVDRDLGYQAYINSNTDSSCLVAPCNDTIAYSIGEVYSGYLGRWWSATDYFFKGDLDEFRVSLTKRAQGWITTGYNNMNATSTFYSIDTESIANGYEPSGYIYSSIYDLGSTDKVLTSLNVNQNVPSGCSLSVTLEGSNDASFATYTSKEVTDNSVANFTTSTPATLNNFRYVRYRLALTSCNNNTQTSTLYSLRLNFR
ncbi:MAG: DUF2341 domain-containing protein [Patescibacteria group bacterium]|jgi:prepilin-type N-terminal cleavage/methylation domain-containing protein